MVASLSPGASVTLEHLARRRGEAADRHPAARSTTRPERRASAASRTWASARLGIAVRPLTAEERRDSDIAGGLVVEDVAGAAERAGVRPGDVIVCGQYHSRSKTVEAAQGDGRQVGQDRGLAGAARRRADLHPGDARLKRLVLPGAGDSPASVPERTVSRPLFFAFAAARGRGLTSDDIVVIS